MGLPAIWAPPIPHIASDLGPLGAYVTSGSGPPPPPPQVMWTPTPTPASERAYFNGRRCAE